MNSRLMESIESAIQAGDLARAFDIYEQIITDSPTADRPLHQFNYAFLLWKCYEIEPASQLFQQLVREQSLPLDALQNIAKCYFQVGRFDVAADVMRGAVTIYPTDADAFFQWSSCLERSDQMELAREAAERALRLVRDHRAAVRQLARIQRRAGNLTQAIGILRDHLQRYPQPPTWLLRYELAACLDRSGDYENAWHELLQGKSEWRSQHRLDLQTSYSIRKRQGELVQSITQVDWKRWHETAVPQPCSLAFLAGFPRSGTTLLESVLAANKSVIGTDESGVLASQFVRPMIWEAPSTLDAVLELRGFSNEQLAAGREAYLKCTQAVLGERIGDRLLLDKDPLLTCDLALPLRLFPEAKLIMPIRDPRDVVLSYFSTILPSQWNGAPSIDIVESARFYHDVLRHWLALRDRLPWPSLETRYEDLVVQPEREAKRLCEFLGLEYAEGMVDSNQRSAQRWVTTPTYEDISKPLYTTSISRWRNYESKLEPALEILEPWARELGYE